MNRNTEQHFTNVPKMHLRRSKFDESHSLKTTWVNGNIVPIYCDPDITPGDTVEMDMGEVVRMATPIFPVMDNLFMDIMWFFIPHRLVWDNWQKFWGESDDPWTQQTNYEIPQLEAPEGGWENGTIADYFGIPTYVEGISVNALPFRGMAKVYNDWFRDENLCYNAHIYHDDTTRTGVNSGTTTTDLEKGGKPAKAAKLHDYFTSSTPSAQKGPAVTIPLGTTAPVRATDKSVYNVKNSTDVETLETLYPSRWTGMERNAADTKWITYNDPYGPKAYNTGVWTSTGVGNQSNTVHSTGPMRVQTNPYDTPTLGTLYWAPENLWADLNQASAATVNELRTAFAIQKYYENATNGTRYIEVLRNVFGVESSDARLQRSEYLGGKRIPINMDTVLQTSSTDATSPQGNTGAFSCTISTDNMFTKSFEEHGTLLGVVVCRTEHSYQQGIPRGFSRKKWTDFYNPFFANLGNMAILEKEIYAQGSSADNEAFGYQEAWADYRYKPNRISGEMRSNNPGGSLDAWHYADDYETKPTLSAAWIEEPTSNVDRTIAVQSEISHQFIGDFYFKCAYVRGMPIYSVPGLIDHV